MGDKLVWLTGFGPFEGAHVNDSWVGVKQMPTQCIKKEFGAVVLKQRIPVKYSFVDYFIPYRWAVLQPDLRSCCRFLCSYIYYTSLGHGVTLFVHVPLNKYSPDQLGCGLSHIVQLTLSHMNRPK
ncbi:hypothetical protein HF086_000498 [Spodoptera exigua]|uniref:Uncharacterized protein n=1 Tax=Spodoptera exigua TaxID=7107 RepID=A0A922MS73_SPOEX|nr:hypothetical protein HF086_000498 [Spodoptera exigua]